MRRFVHALVAAPWLACAAPAPASGAEPPSPWLFDVNLGLPRLESGDFALAADGLLGYGTATWGLTGSGAFGVWDTDAGGTNTQTVRDVGALEGFWIAGGEAEPWRLELRLSAGAALYSSTYDPGTTGRGEYHDEDSLMRRATLLAGGRMATTDWQGVLHLGLGVQHETWDDLTTDPALDLVRSEDHTSLRQEGRLHLRWAALPERLAVRLRAVVSRFAITRSAVVVSQRGAVDREGSDLTQLEAEARLFLDLEAITLLTVVPAAFAGFDLVTLDGDAGSLQATVPVFGLGLVKRVRL